MSTLQDPRVEENQLLDQEWDLPCDYADDDHGWMCSGMAAQWVAYAQCPECSGTAQRLLCTPCKDLVTTTEHGCRCPFCEARIIPFRHVFTRIEPLGRSA